MSYLAQIYIPLCGAVFLGAIASFLLGLPAVQQQFRRSLQHQVPAYLGQFLFWVGVPGSLIHFLRQANLSGGVLIAPVIAWAVFLLSLATAWLWLRMRAAHWQRPTQGAFLLSAMLGNTGYIGYPVVLLLPQLGTEYFGWAVFYDLLGTVFGAYGLGVLIAANFGSNVLEARLSSPWRQSLVTLLKTPTMPAFLLGLLLRPVMLPHWLDKGLQGFAWSMVMFSLVLMGMRLQQLQSWDKLWPAIAASSIRMVLTPFLIGIGITMLGLTGPPRLVMVLQGGMPSALATLVLAETFDLDRELAVTCVGISSAALFLTLPVWLWLFPV